MIKKLFRYFEHFVDPFPEEEPATPPANFWGFVRHYSKPFYPLIACSLLLCICVAIAEVMVFAYVGELVNWLTEHSKEEFWGQYSFKLVLLGLLILVLLPSLNFIYNVIKHQGLLGNYPMRIRWQAHRYLLRQSVGFYKDDFAGRLATKMMQTSLGVRDSVMKMTSVFVYVFVYFTTTLILFADSDWRLTFPLLFWFAGYVVVLYVFIPKIRTISMEQAEARSTVTGRVVDSYTNIEIVKMFSDTTYEDDYAKEGMQSFLDNVYKQMRLATYLDSSLNLLNASLIFLVAATSLYLWNLSLVTAGAIAFSMGVVIKIQGMSQWALWELATLFENIGVVQDGLQTIAQKPKIVDKEDAKPLVMNEGEIAFQDVTFNYEIQSEDEEETIKHVLNNFDLVISPGEKIGVVGRSGAGKSTLVSLLLRFYDIEEGQILIDGQSIGDVTQSSLRKQIAMVSQDSSLLHRSVIENIQYGQSNDMNELNSDGVPLCVIEAAKKAHAHEFILELEDNQGRKGYHAHVGERGVKLSGGQRQRIAIARVILKNAPILILDEATSALDSEVESAIQESLYDLMKGKTVIAIAHRLSTIAEMDRLVVMDNGEVLEQGSHEDLLSHDGLYAKLWHRQSGGFLAMDLDSENS